MQNTSRPSAEPSLASLVGGIINDARDLLLQEFTMAKLEIRDELRRSKEAAVSFGVAIGVAAVGGILLILMLVHLLHTYTELPLWGCYGIVGGVLMLLSLIFFSSGKKAAKNIKVIFPETADTLKENVQWIKETTTSDRV